MSGGFTRREGVRYLISGHKCSGGGERLHEGKQITRRGKRGGGKTRETDVSGGFLPKRVGSITRSQSTRVSGNWGGGGDEGNKHTNIQANTTSQAHYKLKIEIALMPEASAAAQSTRARTKAGRSGPTSSRVSQAREA